MKLLWRIGKEAGRYIWLYVAAILSTVLLTAVSLIAPKIITDMIKIVEDRVSDPMPQIIRLTIILVVLYLLRIVFRYFANYLAHVSAWNLVNNIRMKLYGHMQKLSMNFYHDKQTGDLMSRVINDINIFEVLYAHIIPDLITGIITFVGVIIILLNINVKLAIFTCIPIPFIFLMGMVFVKKIRPQFTEAQKTLGDINSKLQDNFSGIKEVQAFGQEEREYEQVETRSKNYIKALLHALNLSAVFHPSVEFLTSIGNVLVVGLGGYLALNGMLNVSDIVAFFLYLSMFYAPVATFARILEEAQQAYAGAERVFETLDTKVEIVDSPNAVELNDVKGAIEFKDVSFSYIEGQPVLEDISFSCDAGQMVALVGPTGVGKTTLVQLISRFYDPTKGNIYIDGKDTKEVTIESLRQSISLVLQDTFLFYGSIYENIAYAKPDATEEEIVEASKKARIHNDIMMMPDEYATKVGERGVRLSGGQKQRIAIARAILRESPIIILDEATASVDTATEKEIQKAITDVAKNRTIIAIAHRLSTIKNSDIILVLEEGEIVQRGTHNELIQKEGLYKELNKLDKKEELLDEN